MKLSDWTRLLLLAALVGLGTACGEEDTTDPVNNGGSGGSGGDTSGGGEDTNPAVIELMPSEVATLTESVAGPFTFTVPENAVSVTISINGPSDGYVTLADWTDPTGFELVNAGWTSQDPTFCLSCNNRIASSEGAFAAIAPNNPASQLEPGEHTFSVYGFKLEGGLFSQELLPLDGTVEIRVQAKVLPEAPQAGILDLNLYFTGAQGLTAENAPTDAEFQATMDTVREIYGQVGIEIGNLTYQDAPSEYQVIENVMGADSDLMALFATTESQQTNALNLFFVDELKNGDFAFGVILGIAGGIPGPPLWQGTPKSGVAVAIKPVQGAPAQVETTIAHELGHFLGLFHTSEQSFTGIHDPLPDTPDNDASYLMFNTGEGNVLSPWQGIVMRSNPWVRH